MIKQLPMFLVVLTMLCVLPSCSYLQHKQFRTKQSNGVYELLIHNNPVESLSFDDEEYALQEIAVTNEVNYSLGFIESDDQGVLWDRRQMYSVINYLEKISEQEDLIIVVLHMDGIIVRSHLMVILRPLETFLRN